MGLGDDLVGSLYDKLSEVREGVLLLHLGLLGLPDLDVGTYGGISSAWNRYVVLGRIGELNEVGRQLGGVPEVKVF